jgi:hypothetical protein
LIALLLVAGMGATRAHAEAPAAKSKTAQQESQAKSKAAQQEAQAALSKAVAELQKEYADFAAKPDSASLRTASDYFKNGLPTGVTVDDLLAVVGRGLSGSPSEQAYVKWQLMSGCPSKVDGPQAAKVYQAYRSAPAPRPAFSADPNVRKQLDHMVVGMREGQEDAINDQVSKQNEMIKAYNDPILEYRDALYARLPTNGDVLIARLQDAVFRVQAGVDLKNLLSNWSLEIRTWTVSNATPQQANAVMSALKEAQKIKGAVTYKSAKWDEKKKAVVWSPVTAQISAKEAAPIEKQLREYIANPQAAGLKFK